MEPIPSGVHSNYPSYQRENTLRTQFHRFFRMESGIRLRVSAFTQVLSYDMFQSMAPGKLIQLMRTINCPGSDRIIRTMDYTYSHTNRCYCWQINLSIRRRIGRNGANFRVPGCCWRRVVGRRIFMKNSFVFPVLSTVWLAYCVKTQIHAVPNV